MAAEKAAEKYELHVRDGGIPMVIIRLGDNNDPIGVALSPDGVLWTVAPNDRATVSFVDAVKSLAAISGTAEVTAK